MRVTSDLLNVLVCPVTGDKLVYDYKNSRLISPKAKLAFPISDGIPLLLKEQAVGISQEEIEIILKNKD
ncbi:MAG: Trm112 family protein [Rickettsiales bacterium]